MATATVDAEPERSLASSQMDHRRGDLRNLFVAFDFTAREPDELSVRRGEGVQILPLVDAEEGWALVRATDGREGLVPLNHILRRRPELPMDAEAVVRDSREAEREAERLGQSRAMPDWGYDHGLDFEQLESEHPLWMESAIESFVHALLFNTTPWHLADAHVLTVVRHRRTAREAAAQGGDDGAACEAGGGNNQTGGAGDSDSLEVGDRGDGAEQPAVPEAAARLLEAYSRRHREAVGAAGAAPLGAQRFLVAEAGSWGLGNRLYALVSCAALALATNRTLLLRGWFGFPAQMDELFAPPAGLGGWAALSYEAVAARVAAALPGGHAELRAASAVLTLLERNAQRHVVRGARRTFASDHLRLLCGDFAAAQPQPFVHVLSNTYFAPLLLRNPRHARLAAALGPRPFHALARHWLRPSAAVAADVAAFLAARRAELAAATAATAAPAAAASFSSPAAAAAPPPPPPLVGMHVRTQDWMRVPLASYWACLRAVAPPQASVWLVAADAPQLAVPPPLRAEGATVWQRGAARTKLSYLLEAQPRGLRAAAVDLFLLAACDARLVSPMSTFGGFAHGYAASATPPWKVTSFGQCVRARSPEPFFHHWPEVHRQLRAAPADAQCALPAGFYDSAEAHDLGLWLLGGETTPAERRLLVEEPDSPRFFALLARRSAEAAAALEGPLGTGTSVLPLTST